jgi:hypothetical protein
MSRFRAETLGGPDGIDVALQVTTRERKRVQEPIYATKGAGTGKSKNLLQTMKEVKKMVAGGTP